MADIHPPPAFVSDEAGGSNLSDHQVVNQETINGSFKISRRTTGGESAKSRFQPYKTVHSNYALSSKMSNANEHLGKASKNQETE